MEGQSVVDGIADELTRRILAGEYRQGDMLPSVRRIADDYSVNRATAQLILARLASSGFAQAVPGRGYQLLPMHGAGGIDLYCTMFRSSITRPGIAAAMFRDIIDTQHAILADILLEFTLDTAAAVNLDRHVAALESLVAGPDDTDLAAFLTAELGLVRSLTAPALGPLSLTITLALLNSLIAAVLEVPEAVRSYFVVEPDVHVMAWRTLAALAARGTRLTESEVRIFTDLLTSYHARVVGRFDELLTTAGVLAGKDGHAATA